MPEQPAREQQTADRQLDALLQQWAQQEAEPPAQFRQQWTEAIRQAHRQQQTKATVIPLLKKRKTWMSAVAAAVLIVCCIPALQGMGQETIQPEQTPLVAAVPPAGQEAGEGSPAPVGVQPDTPATPENGQSQPGPQMPAVAVEQTNPEAAEEQPVATEVTQPVVTIPEPAGELQEGQLPMVAALLPEDGQTTPTGARAITEEPQGDTADSRTQSRYQQLLALLEELNQQLEDCQQQLEQHAENQELQKQQQELEQKIQQLQQQLRQSQQKPAEE